MVVSRFLSDFLPDRIRVVVRQSPDWRNTPHAELIENSREFCRSVGDATGLSENFIADVVAVWDETFKIPFFGVRAVMKDIAQQNLASVRRARIAGNDAAPDSRDRMTIFIDDDDWLHPDIFSMMRPHLTDDADGYIFGNILCTRDIELRNIENGCYTNSYAITPAFAAADPQNFRRAYQHWDANAVFHAAGFRRVYVPLYLSATNKHPASAMKLKDGLQDNDLSALTLRRLVEKYVDEGASSEVPREARWTSPYRERVRKVFADTL